MFRDYLNNKRNFNSVEHNNTSLKVINSTKAKIVKRINIDQLLNRVKMDKKDNTKNNVKFFSLMLLLVSSVIIIISL